MADFVCPAKFPKACLENLVKYENTKKHMTTNQKRQVKSGTNYAKLGTEGQIGFEQLGGRWMSICIKSHQGQVRLVYGHCGR